MTEHDQTPELASRLKERLLRAIGQSAEQLDQKDQAEVQQRFEQLQRLAIGVNRDAVALLGAFASLPHNHASDARRGSEWGVGGNRVEQRWALELQLGTSVDVKPTDFASPIEAIGPLPVVTIEETPIAIHHIVLELVAAKDVPTGIVSAPRTEIKLNQVRRDPDNPGSELENNELLNGQIAIRIAADGSIEAVQVGRNYATGVENIDTASLEGLEKALRAITASVVYTAKQYETE